MRTKTESPTTRTIRAQPYIPLPILVLTCLFIWRALSRYSSGELDVDYYWHVSYGEWILRHLSLPRVDLWSWTMPGQPYQLTQWLGEVCMGAASLGLGAQGTQLLGAGLMTACLYCSYRAARVYLDNRLAALAVAIGCNTVLVALPCRPHQFTHLGLASLTWILARYDVLPWSGNRWRSLAPLPLIMAGWANLHGGFSFGLAFLWLMVGLRWLDLYVKPRHTTRRMLLPLAVTVAIATLATLATPYGIDTWLNVLKVANLRSTSGGVVDEWLATNIKLESGLNFFMVSSVLWLAMASSSLRPRLKDCLLAFVLCAIGWSAVRVSIMACILMVPLVAKYGSRTPFFTLAFGSTAHRFDRPVLFLPAAACVLALTSLALVVNRDERAFQQLLGAKAPVAEAAFIRAQNLSSLKILNAPETGGYLLHNLGIPVALDTRLDLYRDKPLFAYLFARRGNASWRAYIEEMNADMLLIDNESALRSNVLSGGLYRLVFEGTRYSVLLKPELRPDIASIPETRVGQDVLSQL